MLPLAHYRCDTPEIQRLVLLTSFGGWRHDRFVFLGPPTTPLGMTYLLKLSWGSSGWYSMSNICVNYSVQREFINFNNLMQTSIWHQCSVVLPSTAGCEIGTPYGCWKLTGKVVIVMPRKQINSLIKHLWCHIAFLYSKTLWTLVIAHRKGDFVIQLMNSRNVMPKMFQWWGRSWGHRHWGLPFSRHATLRLFHYDIVVHRYLHG